MKNLMAEKFYQRFLIIIVPAFIFGVILQALVFEESLGQDLGWSTPSRVSARGQTSWFPDIEVDQAGNVHIVWASGVTNYDLVYYTSFMIDGTQKGPIEIRALPAIAGSEVTRPTLFADHKGVLHFTFRDTRVYYSQAEVMQASSAKNWSPDHLVDEGYFSRVAVDSKGRLHYIYTKNVITSSCPICYHVFYSWSDDNGNSWSKEIDISRGPLGSAKPQLLISQDDNLHVVYESGIGGSYGQLSDTDPTNVMYTGSHDKGTTWDTPTQLNPLEMVAKNITIGIDAQNRLIVVWWDINDDSIYSQISTNQGTNWSLPLKLPGVKGIWSEHHARLDDYAMALDSSGGLHLVFVGLLAEQKGGLPTPTLDATRPTPTPTRTPTQTPTPTGVIPTQDLRIRLSLLHMTWNGDSWSTPEVIAAYVGDVPEWPRIAVGLGNQLHVVWFVRAEKDVWSGGGDYTVYYSTKTINTRKLTPIVYPTSIPVMETVIIQEVTKTPTSTPVMDIPDVVQEPAWKIVYKEMDYLSVAVLSALPVVFVVGLLALIVRKFRR